MTPKHFSHSKKEKGKKVKNEFLTLLPSSSYFLQRFCIAIESLLHNPG
jgi:hypothetical protein